MKAFLVDVTQIPASLYSAISFRGHAMHHTFTHSSVGFFVKLLYCRSAIKIFGPRASDLSQVANLRS